MRLCRCRCQLRRPISDSSAAGVVCHRHHGTLKNRGTLKEDPHRPCREGYRENPRRPRGLQRETELVSSLTPWHAQKPRHAQRSPPPTLQRGLQRETEPGSAKMPLVTISEATTVLLPPVVSGSRWVWTTPYGWKMTVGTTVLSVRCC